MDVEEGEGGDCDEEGINGNYRGQGRPFFSYLIDEIIYKNN